MRLIKAYYIAESYEIDGFPIWYEESPDVQFTAKKRVIRSAKVVETAQENAMKQNHSQHGARWYAVPVFKDGKRPTRAEWLRKFEETDGNIDTKPDKIRERDRILEERAKAQIDAQNSSKIEGDNSSP